MKRCDSEILELVTEDEVENEIEQADVFKERLQRAVIDAGNAIKTKDKSPDSTPVASSRASSPLLPSTSPGLHATKVKLPKLSLKKFTGDLTKWPTFWNSFESSIDRNPGLSDVDKFNYLNSLLEGPACEAISGLKLTAANYGEAIAILKKRFGNKQQIIAKHMEVLLNVDMVTSQHNLRGLRQLYDSVESQVRGLKALGVPPESYGSLLSSIIMNKLPQELRLIVSREVKEEEWQLDELMKIVDTEIKARERASNGSSRPTRVPNRDIPTATALVSNDSVVPKCSYCRQSHSSNSCRTVTDPAERKHILRKTGRCYVCLRKHHTSRECHSTLRCNNCTGRHHVSICTGFRAQHSPRIPSAGTPVQPQQLTSHNQAGISAKANVPVNTTPTTTAMQCVTTKVPVLLQTARTCAFKTSTPETTMEVRIIFDSGSQRSYVTNNLKEFLSLDPQHTETMLIKTFGSEKGSKQLCDVVSLGMRLRDGGSVELTFVSAADL